MQAFGLLFGTSAQDLAYGRRNHVETTNSYAGGIFVDLSRTYARALGDTHKFLLDFLVAGINRYIAEPWRARLAAEPNPKRRGKSRTNTLAHISPPKPTGDAGQQVLDRSPGDVPSRT